MVFLFIPIDCLSNDISNNILNALLNSSSSIKPQHQTPNEDGSALMPHTAIPLSMDCVNLMVMQAKVKWGFIYIRAHTDAHACWYMYMYIHTHIFHS